MLSFEHTGYLLGLVIIVPLALLFAWVVRWKIKSRKQLGDKHLIDALTRNYSRRFFAIKFFLLIISVILCILALANLRKSVPAEKEQKAGIDVMIALDVSKSMWSEDIKPSRLEKAKQFINTLTEGLDDNRVGLVVFAGQAFLQMPLTPDIASANMFVSNASPNAVPVQGTAIGDALALCNTSLDTKEKKYKAIILITDGEDHDPKSEEVIKQLNEDGVLVNTIGVGTTEGGPITEPGSKDYKVDENGKTVISKLNEDELKDIATKTGGQYFWLDNSEKVANAVLKDLNSMDKKLISSTSAKKYSSLFPYFLGFVILLLMLEIFIPEVKRRKR